MEKSLAVAMAVRDQLNAEGRWPPENLNKVMGKDYRYDLHTITLFLTGVSGRLRSHTPPYQFNFNSTFAIATLQMNVGELTGAITDATNP